MKEGELTTLLEESDSNPDQNPEEQSNSVLSRVKGVVVMFVYTALISASKISVQALDRSIPDFQLNAMRCGFSTLCMGLYHVITKTSIGVSRENILKVVLVTLTININTICCYVSVTFISLAAAQCLLLTSNLAFGLVMYRLVNKEKVKFDKLVAVPLCVTGVFLVLQPDFIFGDDKDQDKIWNIKFDNFSYSLDTQELGNTTELSSDTNLTNISQRYGISNTLTILGYLLSVATGLLMAIEVSIVKYYESFFTTQNIFKSLFWNYMLGTILSLIPMVVYEHPVFPLGLKEILLVILHVCTYVFTVSLYLYGSLLISGILSAIIRTCIIIYLLAAQYTILKDIHPGHRNWIEIVGVILVLFGTIFSTIVEIVKGFKAEN